MLNHISGLVRYTTAFGTLLFGASSPAFADIATETDIFALSLQELNEALVVTPATLIPIQTRSTPGRVTTITAKDIRESGARSLDELLERFVPDFQMHGTEFSGDFASLRALGSNHFILVNGMPIHDLTQGGSHIERDLTQMGDIREIRVLTGSGATIHGFGAISGVIAIETFSSRTASGTEVRVTKGEVENFATAEFQHAGKWDTNRGYYFYAGVTDYDGATVSDAPAYFGVPGTYRGSINTGQTVDIDDGDGFSVVNHNQNVRNKPAVKLHAQVDIDQFTGWVRYSRGGKRFASRLGAYERQPQDVTDQFEKYYEQISIQLRQLLFTENDWTIDFSLNGDITEAGRNFIVNNRNGFIRRENYREDKSSARIVARNDSWDRHALGIGLEARHDRFGEEVDGWPFQPVRMEAFGTSSPEPWSTNSLGVFFEHQWDITPKLKSIIGFRGDWHSYSEFMASPKLALVYEANNDNTLKLLVNRGNRLPTASTMRSRIVSGADTIEPIQIDSVELIWNRFWRPGLETRLAVHYDEAQLLGFNTSTLSSELVGVDQRWGAELLINAKFGDTSASLSHVHHGLEEGTGLGLHDSLTKFNLRHEFSSNKSVRVSYVRYWGSPDTMEFRDSLVGFGGRQANNPDWDKFAESNNYLHASFNWKPTKNVELGLHGYYLLGLFDEDNNKRLFSHGGSYRSHAPSISASLAIDF